MSMRKLCFIFIPLIMGITIYLLYRSRNLFYYQLLETISVHSYVNTLRSMAKVYRKILSTWMVYSLPDGLWLFSFGAALLIDRFYYLIHVSLYSFIFCIMIGIEHLQKKFGGHGHWLGTYDIHDIEAFVIAYLSILFLSFFMHNKTFEKIRIKTKKRELLEDTVYSLIFIILGTLPSLL